MNLRCAFCQTPYTLSRVEKLSALQHMDAEKLTHYDAHCPRCRKATPIPRQKLEMTFPNWRDALKELEVEMKAHPQHEAPLTQPKIDSAPQTESKSEPVPAKEKPAAKPAAKAKTAEKTSSPKGNTATKKDTKKSK